MAEQTFTWSVKNSDPEKAASGTGTIPPVGVYPAKIDEIKIGWKMDGTTKVPNSKRIELVYRITDGDHKGFPLFDYLLLENEASEWRVDQFMQVFGQADAKKRDGKNKPSDFKGKPCQIRVKHEKDNRDPEGGAVQAKVGAVIKPKADAPAGTYDEEPFDSEEEAAEETATTYTDVELDALAELADAGYETNEDGTAVDETDEGYLAACKLTEIAEEQGVNVEDYPDSWADLAMALYPEDDVPDDDADEDDDDEDDSAESSEAETDAPEADAEDYTTWELPDLKEELKSRGKPVNGPKTALIKRLEDSDANPFAKV